MLKRYSYLFEALFVISDLAVVSLCWVSSYWLRFNLEIIPIDKGIPEFGNYLRMLLFVWGIWAFVFRRFGLYKPMRGASRVRESWALVKANSLCVILLLSVTYLFKEKNVEFSRLVFFVFLIVSTCGILASRNVIRVVLRYMRRRGHNLRYALIVGAGDLAANVAERIRRHPEYGIELIGCLANNDEIPRRSYKRFRVLANGHKYPIISKNKSSSNLQLQNYRHTGLQKDLQQKALAFNRINRSIEGLTDFSSSATINFSTGGSYGLALAENSPEHRLQGLSWEVPVIGVYSDLPYILDEGGIDQVVIALPLQDHAKIEEVVASIGDSIVDVRVVPDLHRFIQLGSEVEEFDGLPVVSLASTPLSGLNKITKRIFDITFSSIFLLATLPLLILISLTIKLTSRGTVFFSQERVGLDGTLFKIHKFRTMRTDAEESGAQFAVRGDPRVTRLGRFLRRFSIDELPQLWNVLVGNMSLVGPRPERPVFIKEFRRYIPRYMLRHKVQAGMTGWAQVNGWRGSTSIEKRIDYDLYYIENWSIMFDIKILFLTIFATIMDRNAY